jgi:hypothetical protein
MQSKEEIPHNELHLYAAELRNLVDTVCASPAFKTSPKSCEFLRHIVENTLGGNVEVLKERLIGMTLLGRDASYDTGADAGVRVRANDVRKRLSAYYKAENGDGQISIDIAPGSYIPRFFREAALSAGEPSRTEVPMQTWAKEDAAPRLSLYRLSGPTLVALFLCTICIRWQMTEEHPFTAFWQDVFQSHRAVLYLPSQGSRSGQVLVDMQELPVVAPLFNLASQFHKQFAVVSAPEAASAGDVFVSLGAGSGGPESTTASEGPIPAAQSEHSRFVVEDTPAGREIVDRSTSDERLRVSGRAALLTIVNGAWRSIRIDGTDDTAIGSAIQMLCERASFPEEMVDSFQKGTITQVVIPMTPHSEAKVFRELLPAAQATTRRGTQ